MEELNALKNLLAKLEKQEFLHKMADRWDSEDRRIEEDRARHIEQVKEKIRQLEEG